jgi:glycosyltransferase involved in cell wall biosynthesis
MLYVSIIDQYKHQWCVVEAIAKLRELGFPIELDLVGPAYTPALKRLNKAIASLDMDGSWVHYHGAIPFDELHLYYAQADLGIFASSCENMPNILLETMGAGLPIACSNRGPMPEVMGGVGSFFDPEKSHDIAKALRELIDSPQTRVELAQTSHGQAKKYSWIQCADDIFRFLTEVVEQRKKGNGDI